MSPSDNELWPETPGRFEPARPSSTHKEMLPKRAMASLAFLVGCLPRRRSGRRALGVITILMAFAGVALLSYPLVTDFWAKSRQNNLRKEFGSQEALEQYKSREIPVGGALTRLVIRKMGACATCHINVIVVQGISGNALRAGAGHYPQTQLPGELGNVAIAGHRTGFGEPFRHLDKLRPGDLITLETPVGTYTYQVVRPPVDGHGNPWITTPNDLSVLAPTIDASLTLTTCDPPHTSKNRLIVRAKLIQSKIVA
jgi:sortase A